jgi:hypothetical protein
VAAALRRLADDPRERATIAARCRAFATSDRFAWPAIARAWERLLLNSLRRPRPEPATARAGAGG